MGQFFGIHLYHQSAELVHTVKAEIQLVRIIVLEPLVLVGTVTEAEIVVVALAHPAHVVMDVIGLQLALVVLAGHAILLIYAYQLLHLARQTALVAMAVDNGFPLALVVLAGPAILLINAYLPQLALIQ